jgi:hypothetical protein
MTTAVPPLTFALCLRWSWPLLAFISWTATSVQAQTPVNDAFAGRLTMTGSTNTVTGNSTLATSEAGEPNHAGHPAVASLWWTWVAPDSGVAVVNTLGSSFDTLLAVYTGTAVNALALVGANDDAPGLATSVVSFNAVRGTTYQFAVDGFAGAGGEVTLTLRLPVAPTPPLITSTRTDWTVPDNAGSNVTFSVTATGSFPISFVWQKDGGPLPGGANSSFTIANASFGHEGDYSVIVTNPYGSITNLAGVLTVLPRPSNDAFANRISIVGQSQTAFGHNFGASIETGEPVHAGVSGGASVWWSWTAPQNGLTRINTTGSTNAAGDFLDTILAVYAGTGLSSLEPVSANDNETPGLLATSRTFFRAQAGVTYQIAVAGAGLQEANGTFATGRIRLNLEQAPDNDFFVNALEFPSGVSTVFDDLSGTTMEPGEPLHAGNPGGRSVWWTWVAPDNGTFVLDTEGSQADTVLGVYTGGTVSTLSVIGADDNRGEGHSSLVKFAAIAGTRYYFGVDGFLQGEGSSGRVLLNLNPALALNDDFAERTSLAGEKIHVSASNVGASKQAGEPNHAGNAGGRSIWWSWTAHFTGRVVISTRDSTFDTTLAVYSGTSLTGLSLIAENDDSNPVTPLAGSLVGFEGVKGQTYQIAVDGFRSGDGTVAEGTVELRLIQSVPPEPGDNDLFANRFLITGQASSVVGNNSTASKESGEPNHGGNVGGRSLWWSWVAPESAPVRMGTLGSSFDTVLGVYRGSSVDALTLVAEDHRRGGAGQSTVTFEAVEGVEYQIAVDGFNVGTGAASGQVRLNVFQHDSGELHANDHFENATPISPVFPTVAGLNIGATRESGEPAHSNTGQGHSVWWTWTAPREAPVTISTARSQFDTLLAVYTGTNVADLTLVTENDDISPGNLQSEVTFQAIAGTTYRIAVDGYANQIGVIALTVSLGASVPAAPRIQQAPFDQTRFSGGAGGGADVRFRVVATGSPPLSYQWRREGVDLAGETKDVLTVATATADDAGRYQVIVRNAFGSVTNSGAALTILEAPFNDDFAGRIRINGSMSTVRGSILGATKQSGEPLHGGKAGGRSVWWNWIAPEDGPVEIHTIGSSFDTLLAVYQGTDPGNLGLIEENNDLQSGSTYSSRVLFSAVAGQEYQIAVDGVKTNTIDGSVVLTVRQSAGVAEVTLLNNLTDEAQWNSGAGASFADAGALNGFSFSASSGGFALKQVRVIANFNDTAVTTWEVRLYRVGSDAMVPSGGAALLKSQQFSGVAVTANPSPIQFDLPAGWNLAPHQRYAIAFRVVTGNSPFLLLPQSTTGVRPTGSVGVNHLTSFLSADGGNSFSATTGVYGYQIVGEPLVTTPVLTKVSPPPNGSYLAGESLDFMLRFSETVLVNPSGGAPALLLDVGGATRSATYLWGSGTTKLVFRYLVQTGDLELNGIAIIGATANGGTIRNSSGLDANLSLNAPVGTTGVLIEPAPVIVSSTWLTPLGFELRFQAPATGTFRVETTSDFVAWRALGTVQASGVAGATLVFIDYENPSPTQRFYRVVVVREPIVLSGERLTGGGLAISWPLSAEGYILESSPVLGSAAHWTAVENIETETGRHHIEVDPQADALFFRLRRL